MEMIRKMLQGLTLEDIREWAGRTIYNRGRGYVGQVSQLSWTSDGTLVAWVSGSDDYAASVRPDSKGSFDFDCTCPYDHGGPCKHVVAVLLVAADHLKKNQEIPLLDPEDDLYLELFDESEDEDEDEEEEDYGEDEDEEAEGLPVVRGRSSRIEALLAGKSRDDLESLLVDLASRFPEVARRIQDMGQLESGQVAKLVRSLGQEIRRVTAEEAWYNPWKHEGNLPDYSHIEEQLRALLHKGHADAVFQLGRELWERGNQQVGHSHDEGETAMALSSCLEIVIEALPKSSLKAAEQLLWLVECLLADEFDLLTGAGDLLESPRFTQDHWRAVAPALEARLKRETGQKGADSFDTYRRRGIMHWLCRVYVESGQKQKVIPLLEAEADRNQSYETLVEALRKAEDRDRARQWCLRGFEKTAKEAPGIAHRLRGALREMAGEEGRFDLVAAYRAEDFFDHPAKDSFLELRQAAEKIQAWHQVRERVLDSLRTGKRAGDTNWPLPEPEVKTPGAAPKTGRGKAPNLEMLIEIALLEKRLDDAVAIYRDYHKTRRWGSGIDHQVAEAVAQSHPDVSLEIWKSTVDSLIAQVKPKAYQEAAAYLKKMLKVYQKSGRSPEWQALLLNLRTEHRAKRRLMEILNSLEGGGQPSAEREKGPRRT
ncbi:MAG: SWIM zinc finger domain-containing protein [Deltaproteobacteria bacterium]|nr:SWIM zinc finger domain-containing protein [Deltaproteobacteria bacterium]